MNKVSILDCTLRDGGYINQWKFGKEEINDIITGLTYAGIDIIECGFLRDVPYDPNQSVFSCVSQITPLIAPKQKNSMYVAMIALGDIAPEEILPNDGSSIDGIRLTFHKHEWEEAKRTATTLMEKGYRIFIQPVGTTSYSDAELLQLISDVNRLEPFAFYLVDTLGILYRHDLLRLFYLIDHNLNPTVKVGFHSHNNLQLSFSNAQELMRMNTKREIIIDASVYGMGRGVGNLATELLAEYINVNIVQKYRISHLLAIADRYLFSIYAEQRWGYDLPYFLSAVEKCHPNYAAYLLQKETLNMEDISKILSLLPSDQRDMYHQDLVERLYLSLQDCQIDDLDVRRELAQQLNGRAALLLAPGASLNSSQKEIQQYIDTEVPVVIAVNFAPEQYTADLLFISNRKRLGSLSEAVSAFPCVVATSNLIRDLSGNIKFVNYTSYLGEGHSSDNAGAMLIRLLVLSGISQIALAGFDGFDVDSSNNYCVASYKTMMDRKAAEQKNADISRQLKMALDGTPHRFLTPTRYSVL